MIRKISHNSHRKNCMRLALLCSAAMLSGAPAAFAAEDAPPAPAAKTEQTGISDIIVTANRRQERNQDVPIAITALSADLLAKKGIGKEQDLAASVPSLVVGPNGQNSREAMSFTIRGQGATFQASPGVVVYMNEVPLPAPLTLSQQGGPGNFMDLENMQVLSGPQGTLFGRNTTGGAVLLVPKKPTNNTTGYIKGQYGNYNDNEFEGAVNLPVVDEKLLVRVAAAYQDRDGFTQDVVWNKFRDNKHWFAGRIGILARPVEGVENYTMIYGSKSRNNGTGMIHRGFNTDAMAGLGLCSTLGIGVVGGYSCDVYKAATAQANALGPRKTAMSTDGFQKTETWGITNTTDVTLTDNLKLRNIISFQRFWSMYSVDDDATVLMQHELDPSHLPAPGTVTLPGVGTPITYGATPGYSQYPRDNLKGFTEELQLQGSAFTDKLKYTVGAFYYNQTPAGVQGTGATLYCPALYTGMTAFVGGCNTTHQFSGVSNQSKALYAQGTLDLGALSPALDRLRLTGGYRMTWDRVSGFATQWQANPTNVAQLICGATNAPTTAATAYQDCLFSKVLNTNSPSWLIGLDYKVSPRILTYGKISHSYKAGGFNPYAVYVNTQTFNPEIVTSYELGIKSDFKLGTVPARFNASIYNVDYTNAQKASGDYNPLTQAGGARVANGDARIRGIELEASIRPLAGVEIGGNFSYTDAKWTNYQAVTVAGQADCSTGGYAAPFTKAQLTCLPFQYVSPYIWSIHLAIDKNLPDNMGKGSLYVSYSHSSAQYTDAQILPKEQPGAWLEPYGLLNVSADIKEVAGSNFDVGLFATNLTNKLYRISNSNVYQSGGLLLWSTIYGEPRMYGIRLKYHFGE